VLVAVLVAAFAVAAALVALVAAVLATPYLVARGVRRRLAQGHAGATSKRTSKPSTAGFSRRFAGPPLSTSN
jgi:hypothetical protein